MDNIYLQSFERFDTILNLSTKEILTNEEKSIPTSGWYYYIKETLCYLLLNNHRVFLAFGNDVFEINEDSVAAQFENVFELHKKNDLLLKFSYSKKPGNLDDDIFGFTEDEDLDWGLFLKNIINNPSRREIIFKVKNERK